MEDQASAGPSNASARPTQVCSVPNARPLYPSIDEVPLSTVLSEIIDPGSLEAEELAFVPLLEEVCSWKPSLMESQRKRTSRFMRWAFIALGRVLYFLKTMNMGDGDESACRKLQGLWEKLQTFGSDLTWLEVHVQSALERAEQVRSLAEEVAGSEIDMKKPRANLAVAEAAPEEEKGFVEMDMDAQLG